MKKHIENENVLWYVVSIVSILLLTYFSYNNIAFEEKYVVLLIGAVGVLFAIFKKELTIISFVMLMFFALIERSVILAVASIIVMISVIYTKNYNDTKNIGIIDMLSMSLIALVIIGGGIKHPIVFLLVIVIYVYLYYDSKKYNYLPIGILLNLFINAITYKINSFSNIVEITGIKSISDYFSYILLNIDNKIILEKTIIINLIKAQYYIYICMYFSFFVIPKCLKIYDGKIKIKNIKNIKAINSIVITVVTGIFIYIAHNMSIILYILKCFLENSESKIKIENIYSYFSIIKSSYLQVINNEWLLSFKWYHIIFVVMISGVICYALEIVLKRERMKYEVLPSKISIIMYLMLYIFVLLTAFQPELITLAGDNLNSGVAYLRSIDGGIVKSPTINKNNISKNQANYIGNLRIEGNIVSMGNNIIDEKYKETIDAHMLGSTKPDNHVWLEFYSQKLGEILLIDGNIVSGGRQFYRFLDNEWTRIMVVSGGCKDDSYEKCVGEMILSWKIADIFDKKYGRE